MEKITNLLPGKKLLLILFLGILLVGIGVSTIYSEGDFIESFDTSQQVNAAGGLDNNGTFFWLVDGGGANIFKYHMNGTYANDVIASPSNPGWGVAVYGDWIYSSDDSDELVYKMWLNGTEHSSWAPGQTCDAGCPSAIMTDGTNIWVCDGSDNLLYKYNMAGSYVSTLDVGAIGGVAGIAGCAKYGDYFYLSDSAPDTIKKLWLNGTMKENFSVSVKQDYASGVMLSQDGLYLYGADNTADDVHVYAGPNTPLFEPINATLISPTNNTNSTAPSITFNCSAWSAINLTNVSLMVDGVVSETNVSGINDTFYIFEKELAEGSYNWTCRAMANDTGISTPGIRFLNIDRLQENETFYNPVTYETSEETFVLNLSTNGSYTTSAIFFYNDVPQGASTKTGTDSNANYSNTIQIPTSIGERTFLWQVTVGSTLINSTAINQTVGNTLFGLCNATLTVPYINFTFVDEETSLNMNATIDTSTWSYWLGDGTYTKSLIYSNNTLNDFYGFCLTPGNVTLQNTRSLQYASVGYPQRKYDASSDLTNSTTNKTLYLLSSSDGIYSTIQVVDTNSNQLTDVEVTAERQFVGVWTVVGEETTDSAGSVTFWVNPDYDHQFTFAKDGCTGTTVTIRPTQTQYTQQLQCAGSSSDYTATIEGIKYSRTPTGGILQAGTYNFTYYLVSSKDNIINASFYLVNASDQTVLDSSVSACTPSGCLLYLMYAVNSGDSIKGKYYVDVGNGSILLEGDAWWRSVDIPTAGKAGIKTFFQDVIYIFQEWGDDSDTADFNRLVFIFFFMCIAIAVLNYNFNMDSMNPGMFLTILTLFIVMGSIIGGFSPTEEIHGLFYYNNLSTNEYINNYLLAGIMILISFASFLNLNRQAQR